MDNEIDWEEIFTAMGLEWKEKLSVIKSARHSYPATHG